MAKPKPAPRPLPDPVRIPRTEPKPGRNWRLSAACADTDPGWFFPEDWAETGVFTPGITASQRQRERADLLSVVKNVCAGCPVRLECLQDAIATDDRDGLRGGLTFRDRTKLGLQAGRRDTRPRSDERVAS